MNKATNVELDSMDKALLTQQDFFVLIGLMFVMSFFPHFPQDFLFGAPGFYYTTFLHANFKFSSIYELHQIQVTHIKNTVCFAC